EADLAAHPDRTFKGWIRRLATWAVHARYQQLKRSGLLACTEAELDQREKVAASSTLADQKLIRHRQNAFQRKILEEAWTHLTDEQRTTLRVFWEGMSDAKPGTVHQQRSATLDVVADHLTREHRLACKADRCGAHQGGDEHLAFCRSSSCGRHAFSR